MSVDLLPERDIQASLQTIPEGLIYGTEVESANMLNRPLLDHYRCPEDFLGLRLRGALSSDKGYFRFGPNATCYGRSTSIVCDKPEDHLLHDSVADVVIEDRQVSLPFDPAEIIDNLRLERYPGSGYDENGYNTLSKKLYYLVRPFTNLKMRKQIQKFHTRNWAKRQFPRWPVDTTVENVCEKLLSLSIEAGGIDQVPFVWFWPGGARGCLVITHDVENQAGRDFCQYLMDLDDSFGFKASFQIIPEGRYSVSSEFIQTIRDRGFEIAVQDLNHDGKLFDDRKEFLRRAAVINHRAAEYGAKGFRAGILYRRPEWYGSLDVSYDMSIPNVGHLDPQPGGCCTVMPYFIGNILELPVTASQDYALFHLLNERSIDLWKTQTDLILAQNGVASFIVHPDYVIEPDTRSVYESLLGYLRELRDKRDIWSALPGEVDSWWRARSKMSIVKENNSWRIIGEGAERAVLAYARNVDGKLIYELTNARLTNAARRA